MAEHPRLLAGTVAQHALHLIQVHQVLLDQAFPTVRAIAASREPSADRECTRPKFRDSNRCSRTTAETRLRHETSKSFRCRAKRRLGTAKDFRFSEKYRGHLRAQS